MLTIYGSDLSVFVSKVRFVAHAIGLEYDYKIVKLRDGEHRSPEYLAINPAGKIPAIDDDGFVLFESDAIIRYLADTYDSNLYPKDRCARALVDQWMSFVTNHIGSPVNKIVFNRIFAPRMQFPVDERAIQDGGKFLNRFLPVIEAQLSKYSHLAGDTLSLADMNLLAALDPVELADISLVKYENICAWRSRLKAQEFYTQCYKNYGESLIKK